MSANALGLEHFWTSADALIQLTTYVLLLMSVMSWFIIFWKGWNWLRARRAVARIETFWSARSLEAGVTALAPIDHEALFTPLAQAALQATRIGQKSTPPMGSLNAHMAHSERVTRALRQAINQASAQLESGLTLLASVGSTAPFVGLFGTVWGIYHALISIAASGQMAIDKITAPVGEALIMTALGLAVAIPAVLAYNAFTRINRVLLAELDGFAHDLHAFVTMDPPPSPITDAP